MEDIKKAWEDKVKGAFHEDKVLQDFLVKTLESFAHRYLATTRTPEIKVQGLSKALLIEGQEDNMGQAFKIQNAKAKEGIKGLAKTVPAKDRPVVVSRVLVYFDQLDPDLGKMTITAQVNWGHPTHDWESSQKIDQKKVFKWSDLTELRKGFPLALEEVCDLFL